uniref:phytol kinase n=1 Tax=Mycena chlorophos TaxID=658473 RepID=A0ABQ0M1L1_MYCCL|nr:predicted protein [Mycena chlorophos]
MTEARRYTLTAADCHLRFSRLLPALMHSSLWLSNINRLPPRLKMLAQRALRAPYPLDPVYAALQDPRTAKSDAILFLPVVYINLDTEDTPLLADGADLVNDPALKARIYRVLQSFQCLEKLHKSVDSDAIDDLWPRCWAWMHVVQAWSEVIPLPSHEGDLRGSWVLLVRQLIERCVQRKRNLIAWTPDLRMMIAEVWAIYLKLPQQPDNIDTLRGLSGTLALLAASDYPLEDHYMELVAGAGGRDALASLFITQLQRETHAGLERISETGLRRLAGVSAHLLSAMHHIGRELREQGIVTEITHACLALCRIKRTSAEDIRTGVMFLMNFLRALFGFISDPHADTYIAEALRAGLLDLVFMSSAAKLSVGTEKLLLFCDLALPQFMALEQVASIVGDFAESAENLGIDLSEADEASWNTFATAARSRTTSWRMSKTGTGLWACANVECTVIKARHDFKQCSQCQRVLYCSTACQRTHWRSQHREDCLQMAKPLATHALKRPRDISFLCSLVLEQYLSSRLAILREIFLSLCIDPTAHDDDEDDDTEEEDAMDWWDERCVDRVLGMMDEDTQAFSGLQPFA